MFAHFKRLAPLLDTVHKYTENITITTESLCLEEIILKKWYSENMPNFNNAKKLVADTYSWTTVALVLLLHKNS